MLPKNWNDMTSAEKWEEIKYQRNIYLLKCDWTQLLDVVLTEAEIVAWRDYRQALRDIPQTYPNPDDVIFPERPA